MSLLGSMLLDEQIIPSVLSFIRSGEDFYKEAHGQLFRAIVEVYDRTNSLDLVQIQNRLRDLQVYELVGGDQYLMDLVNSVPTAVNAPHFAKIVAEKAKLRRLIDAAGTILYDAYHVGELGPDGAREVLDKAEMQVFEIAQEQNAADPESLAQLLELEMQRIEAADFEGGGLSGVPTGYGDLDEYLRGLQQGELLILAARPSMGKTALALNLAEQIAMGGSTVLGAAGSARTPVGVFSLEMSKNALVQRLLSQRSGVSSQALRGGHRIPDTDLRKLMMAAEDLKSAPIYIDDTPGMTVLNLRARARRMVAQHGVKVLMIDYLQLMSAPGAARESRQVEVSTISRGVKALARELKVPVICLSQLNRASEQREGNRPRMADLRESGSIEQDADVIMLLHREEYYHIQEEDWKLENPDKVGLAEIIIAKQRNGPTGTVKLVWDSNATRFRSFDAHAQAPGGMRDLDSGFSANRAPRSGYGSASQAAQQFSDPSPRSQPGGSGGKSGGAGGGAGGGGGGGGAKPWTQAMSDEAPPFDIVVKPSQGPTPGQGSAFGARPRSGPIENHRDGGGPDVNDGGIADEDMG